MNAKCGVRNVNPEHSALRISHFLKLRPLFERDPFLNRIRQTPEFIQFMAEMKAQFERYKREFE